MNTSLNLYDEWNALLLKEYFGPANDGEQVWIQTTREELDEFGFRLGGTAGLIDAVKTGPSWSNWSPKHIVLIVNSLVRQRNSAASRMAAYKDPGRHEELYENLDAPAYMPYVALFVLAASEVGEGGYYATTAELSDGFFESSEDSRELLRSVWNDLSRLDYRPRWANMEGFPVLRSASTPTSGWRKRRLWSHRKTESSCRGSLRGWA